MLGSTNKLWPKPSSKTARCTLRGRVSRLHCEVDGPIRYVTGDNLLLLTTSHPGLDACALSLHEAGFCLLRPHAVLLWKIRTETFLALSRPRSIALYLGVRKNSSLIRGKRVLELYSQGMWRLYGGLVLHLGN